MGSREAKHITIKDVAAQAGVSISAVSFALGGKPGVSAETRARVQAAAEALGYQPNSLASGLKRKPLRIAVLLPAPAGNESHVRIDSGIAAHSYSIHMEPVSGYGQESVESRLFLREHKEQTYFDLVWRGIADFCAHANVKLECVSFFYEEKTRAGIASQIMEAARTRTLNGMLAAGHIDLFSKKEWSCLRAQGFGTVFVNSQGAEEDRLCSVQPDYDIIGRTMAELITGHIPPFASILMCAGNPAWEAHAAVVRGFEAYLAENGVRNQLHKKYVREGTENDYAGIAEALADPNAAACCSVHAQGSLLLGRLLEASGRAGEIYAAASDLTDAAANQIRRGVFNSAIQKNPYAQGYLGMRALTEYLTAGKQPEPVIYVGSEIVLKSNLPMYEHGRYRYQFF